MNSKTSMNDTPNDFGPFQKFTKVVQNFVVLLTGKKSEQENLNDNFFSDSDVIYGRPLVRSFFPILLCSRKG